MQQSQGDQVQELVRALRSGGDWIPLLERVQSVSSQTWTPEGDLVFDPSVLRTTFEGVCELLALQRIGPLEAADLLDALPQAPPTVALPEPDARWTLGPLLGLGGMGEVRQVRDGRLRRDVAHKRLLAPQPPPEQVARFVHEAQITAQLEHPNIVPVYDLQFDDAGRPVLCMRRVDGRSLRQALDAGELTNLDERLLVFRKLCDAVAYAHSRGVIHRDLKADNVMVGAFGEVQLMDWGLAKLIGGDELAVATVRSDDDASKTRAGAIAGTPLCMAPEQALGRIEQVGPRSDVYALGVLLYELVCGERPFSGSATEVLAAVREGAFVPPSAHAPVSRPLEAIVLRAMAHQPEDRFSDVVSLRSDVEAYQAGDAIQSLEYSVMDRARLWSARHRQRVISVGLTAALALAVGLAGVTRLAADIARARDNAMEERDRARNAEQLALEQVMDAQLASARAALATESWFEAQSRWHTALQLGQDLGLDVREAELGLAWAGHRAPPPWWTHPEVLEHAADAGVLLFRSEGGVHVARWPDLVVEPAADLPPGDLGFWAGQPVVATVDQGELVVLDARGAELTRRALAEPIEEIVMHRGQILAHGQRLAGILDADGGWTELVMPGTPGRPLRLEGRYLVTVNEVGNDDVFQRDGQHVASTERVLEVVGDEWLTAGQGRLRLEGPQGEAWTVASAPVASATATPDQRWVAVLGFDDYVQVLELETGALVAELPAQRARTVGWLDDTTLSVVDAQGVLGVWPIPQARAGWRELELGGVGFSFSPDGTQVLVATWEGTAVLVDVASGAVTQRLTGPEQGIRDAQFSEDGERALLAGRDGQAWIVDVASGEVLARVPLESLLTTVVEVNGEPLGVGASGEFRGVQGTLGVAHPDVIWELELDRASGRMVTTGRGDADGSFRIWDDQRRLLAQVDMGMPVYRAALTTDRAVAGAHDGRVVVVDLEGTELLSVQAHAGPALAVALHDELLVTTGYDLALRVFDATDGELLFGMQPFSQPGVDVAFSPDGRWLVALSGAGELLIFDVERAARLEQTHGTEAGLILRRAPVD